MVLYEATGDESYQITARDFLKRASRCCIGVSWLARLARSFGPCDEIPEIDEMSAEAVESIRGRLVEWGAVGRRFEQKLSQISKNLQSTEHKAFHQGLKGLGETLGFYAEIPEGNAAPDCIWSIGNMVYVVHEAKSEHTPGDPIGVNDVRQAQSHNNWVRANRTRETNTKILCLIESPRTTVAPEAIAHAESLHHVTPGQLRGIFDEISATLRRVRSKLTDLSDEKVLEVLSLKLTTGSLVPMSSWRDQILREFTPGGLGDNATKEFVLRHVFETAPELIKEPSDLLRILLRRHYRVKHIPATMDKRFIQILRQNDDFIDWPLDTIIPDREAFFAFLQERWPIFLDQSAKQNDARVRWMGEAYGLEYPGPVYLPFDHDDIRVYIDNFFIEGLLRKRL